MEKITKYKITQRVCADVTFPLEFKCGKTSGNMAACSWGNCKRVGSEANDYLLRLKVVGLVSNPDNLPKNQWSNTFARIWVSSFL